MPYLGKTPSQATRKRYYKTASGSETSISGTMTVGGTLTFTDGEFVDVSVNGVALVAGTDYNTDTANTIAGLSALSANDQVEIVVYDTFSVFSGDVDSNMSVGGNLSVTGTSTFSSDISFPDNAAILMGAGNDLKIFHNGSNSQINDLSTGNLQLLSNGAGVDVLKTDGEVMAKFITDGAVELYHDNSKKLETASTGVDITGGGTATDTCTFSSANNVAQLILKSTDADADSGPQLDLTRDSGSPADGDSLGLIRFMFDNDAGQSIVASQFETSIVDASDSTEDGRLIIRTMTAGTSTSRLDFTNTETVFNDSSIDVDFRVESNGNDKMIFVDGENDFVGIGGTPNVTLHVVGPSGQIAIDTTSGGEPLLRFRENGSTRGLLKMDGTNTMEFHTGPDGSVAQVGSFESDGDFLVGKTSDSFGTVGTALKSTGEVNMTRDGAVVLSIRRNTNAGNIIEFYADTTTIGVIGESADALYIGAYNTGLVFEGYQDDSIVPFSPSDSNIRDNAIKLGYGSSRFAELFMVNTSINTSDETEKQDIAALTSAEMTAAKSISALFKTYKWKDAVASKGESARTHTGVIAQEVQAAMSAAGLDATKYAFWCSDTWWETSTEVAAVKGVDAVYEDVVIPAVEAQRDGDGDVYAQATEERTERRLVKEGVEAKDAYTRIDTYNTESEAPEGATKRTRLGVRYPELLAFIGAATEQRLADIETRLTALEAK